MTKAHSDTEFQRLMRGLGKAKARYDLVVRDVAVNEQEDGTFSVPRGDYEAWRDASARLRRADDAMIEFLERSIAHTE